MTFTWHGNIVTYIGIVSPVCLFIFAAEDAVVLNVTSVDSIAFKIQIKDDRLRLLRDT